MDILYIAGFRSQRRDNEEPEAPAPSDQAHDAGADHSPGQALNTSCQSAELAHIDLIKAIAACTNNKDVFLCLLRFHAR